METFAPENILYKSLVGLGLTKYGLALPSHPRATSFVWILSTDSFPQPPNIRGVWTDDGIWEADSVWYR